MLTYPWKCTVLHCNHLGNTWKPLVLLTRHFDYFLSASEGDNQSVRSSAPVVSRCFPGGYNVKLYISMVVTGFFAQWSATWGSIIEVSKISHHHLYITAGALHISAVTAPVRHLPYIGQRLPCVWSCGESSLGIYNSMAMHWRHSKVCLVWRESEREICLWGNYQMYVIHSYIWRITSSWCYENSEGAPRSLLNRIQPHNNKYYWFVQFGVTALYIKYDCFVYCVTLHHIIYDCFVQFGVTA